LAINARKCETARERTSEGAPAMSLTSFVATPDFNEYKERFKQHYKMERRDDGVILIQAHTVT
jgi:hypothetical protein